MSSQEIALDIEELNKLLCITTRPRIKDMLSSELQRLQSLEYSDKVTAKSEVSTATSDQVSQKKPDENVSQNVESVKRTAGGHCIATSKSTPQRYYKELMTYAWDQSDKFMKIYVTLNGVHKLDKSKVSVEYTSRSFQLKVDDLEGANYICRVVGLWDLISTADSYHKVKTDTVLLMLKKVEEKKTWAYVTEREDKKKTVPKFDEKKDPNEGLIDLLKNMYDDGDDEMKRTIAKAWTESRNKTQNDA